MIDGQIESVPKDAAFVVLKMKTKPPREAVLELYKKIRARLGSAPIVVMGPEDSIESYSEEQMKELGWVRLMDRE